MPALRLAMLAVGADVVAQARAAGADRRAQDVLDRFGKPRAARKRQPVRRRARIDAGAKQALARVDVADADDAPPVQQELLDRRAMLSGERIKARRVERARQRLDAEVREQRMRVHGILRPQDGAEAPRIAQPQHAVAEHEIEVIVLLRRRARCQHAQAAGHAQMQDQMAVAAIDQQVLAAP